MWLIQLAFLFFKCKFPYGTLILITKVSERKMNHVYVHYLPVNLGFGDKSCTQSAVFVTGTNLEAEEWSDYHQTCQCMPEASFIVCTLLLRMARCFDACQYVPYVVWQNENEDKIRGDILRMCEVTGRCSRCMLWHSFGTWRKLPCSPWPKWRFSDS